MSSKARNVANTPPTDTPTTRTKRELPPLVEIDQPVEAPPVAPKKAKTDVVHELQKRNNEQKAEPQPVAPTIRIVGGELPKIGIEGVVVASEVKQGSKPKVMFTMAVKQVRANGAFDVIESGVPGFEWLLPTYKGIKASVVDASPSATATQRKEEEPRRSAVEDLGHKTIWLGYLKNATVFASNGNGEMKEGSAMIVPGMQVSATGVVANVVDEKLYLNIPNCNPKLDSVDQSRAAAMLIQEFSKDCFMKQSAILLSMTMGGFFGWNSPTAAQDVQASYFRAAWTKIRDGTASACNSKGHAAACRGDDTGAVVMEAHAERIRSYCPSEFARGTQSFFVDQRDANPEYPMFVTQLVHKVDKFGHDNMINRLFDAAAADGDGCNPSYKELPGMFASPHVGHVEVVGQLLYVKMNLSFVGCKENAMQQLMDGVDPTIDCSVGQDTKQCIATKLLLRDVGPGIAGVSIATKVAGRGVDPEIWRLDDVRAGDASRPVQEQRRRVPDPLRHHSRRHPCDNAENRGASQRGVYHQRADRRCNAVRLRARPDHCAGERKGQRPSASLPATACARLSGSYLLLGVQTECQDADPPTE